MVGSMRHRSSATSRRQVRAAGQDGVRGTVHGTFELGPRGWHPRAHRGLQRGFSVRVGNFNEKMSAAIGIGVILASSHCGRLGPISAR
eukprot:7969621-Pyramimonas_sp.AAC.1